MKELGQRRDWLVHGNGPTEPELQVVITGGWCVAKKKGTYIQRTPPPMEKKKRVKKKGKKKKLGADYGYRTRELRLHNLMVPPPTPHRHELRNSLHFF